MGSKGEFIRKLSSKFQTLIDVLNVSTTNDVLKDVDNFLTESIAKAIQIEKLKGEGFFNKKADFPPNKHFDKAKYQFYSTKKKRQTDKKKFVPKPSAKERFNIKDDLMKGAFEFCIICHTQNISGNNQRIACSNCRGWVHIDCESDCYLLHPYFCSLCRVGAQNNL